MSNAFGSASVAMSYGIFRVKGYVMWGRLKKKNCLPSTSLLTLPTPMLQLPPEMLWRASHHTTWPVCDPLLGQPP